MKSTLILLIVVFSAALGGTPIVSDSYGTACASEALDAAAAETDTAGDTDEAVLEAPPPSPQLPAAAGVAPQAPSSRRCPQCGFHRACWDRPHRDGHRHMMDHKGGYGRSRPGRHGHQGMRMGREHRGAMAGRGPGIAAARILRHAEKLELSDQQISQLEELSLGARKQMVDLRAAIEKEHLELEELLRSDSDDLTTIRKHLNALAEKHVDVQELKLRNWIEVKKILTEDQKEKIRKKHPRMGMILD
jgi:hypothetical protein